MDAIIAIAMLCQTTASGYGRSLTETHQFQLKCQQDYIECYFGKTAIRDVKQSEAQQYLYECVLERKTKRTAK